VLQVYESTKRAVIKCQKGKGPVFLEFVTYRLRGHVGPDDNIQGNHTDIRPKEEIAKWQKKDPIKKFERFLIKNKILNEQNLQVINQIAENEISDAYNFARNSPYPDKGEVTKHVFK
jgi:pyruvate dehydrogenase E1 component alpha subunit